MLKKLWVFAILILHGFSCFSFIPPKLVPYINNPFSQKEIVALLNGSKDGVRELKNILLLGDLIKSIQLKAHLFFEIENDQIAIKVEGSTQELSCNFDKESFIKILDPELTYLVQGLALTAKNSAVKEFATIEEGIFGKFYHWQKEHLPRIQAPQVATFNYITKLISLCRFISADVFLENENVYTNINFYDVILLVKIKQELSTLARQIQQFPHPENKSEQDFLMKIKKQTIQWHKDNVEPGIEAINAILEEFKNQGFFVPEAVKGDA